ncbi:creatininase family protein [Nonomuraea turcica]|uniref:creatininase family protein n=1 Tax=Nonomuraea sp. G32 TaxID=3067274 RepID=UPI00273C16CE|nr:creatininase family protein [Nonomuraea sp. G32]MDP4508017.1 hypothetical protein [Nonomuraea sp. G32]
MARQCRRPRRRTAHPVRAAGTASTPSGTDELIGRRGISAKPLFALINDIQASLRASGIHQLVLINAHGGNYVLSDVVQEATVTEQCMALEGPGSPSPPLARRSAPASAGSIRRRHRPTGGVPPAGAAPAPGWRAGSHQNRWRLYLSARQIGHSQSMVILKYRSDHIWASPSIS